MIEGCVKIDPLWHGILMRTRPEILFTIGENWRETMGKSSAEIRHKNYAHDYLSSEQVERCPKRMFRRGNLDPNRWQSSDCVLLGQFSTLLRVLEPLKNRRFLAKCKKQWTQAVKTLVLSFQIGLGSSKGRSVDFSSWGSYIFSCDLLFSFPTDRLVNNKLVRDRRRLHEIWHAIIIFNEVAA